MIPRDSFRYEGTESHGPGLDVPSPRACSHWPYPLVNSQNASFSAWDMSQCVLGQGYVTLCRDLPSLPTGPEQGLGRLQSLLSLPWLACASASPKPEQWWSLLNQSAHVQTPSNRSWRGFSHHERLYLLEEILLPSPMTVASVGGSAVAHDGLASTRKHAPGPTGLAVGGCPLASSCPENSRQRRKRDGGDWS